MNGALVDLLYEEKSRIIGKDRQARILVFGGRKIPVHILK
ncbi:rCG35567 [Rattus norvegicus]|uniref:RCG35567 n=1 Tax=Rattus norvegicus TaxID=10116 RepID=A6HDK1_RAT|nr:rCG35567 [Rattus norvegicus]